MPESPITTVYAGQRPTSLLALAAHDLRQPIQSIGLFARLLQGDCADAERRRSAAIIGMAAMSLEDMLDKLLMLDQLGPAVERSRLRTIVLDEVLQPTLVRFGEVAAERLSTLEASGLDLAAETEPVLLGLAVEGLLLHGLRSCLGAVGARTVGLHGQRDGERHVRIDLVYSGADPTEALQRQAFVELPPTRAAPSGVILGLGLASIALIAAHLGLVIGHDRTAGGARRISLQLAAAPKP